MKIGPIEGTLRACADPTIGDREVEYHAALREVAGFELARERLVFRNSQGETILEFTVWDRFDMNPAELVGTTWQLETLDGSSSTGEPITLTIREERVEGFAGCRFYDGTYLVERDEIHFTSLSMRATECDDQVRSVREHEFLSIFSESSQYRMRNDRLELFTAAGDRLVFRRTSR